VGGDFGELQRDARMEHSNLRNTGQLRPESPQKLFEDSSLNLFSGRRIQFHRFFAEETVLY
jgi:hypothetical protein